MHSKNSPIALVARELRRFPTPVAYLIAFSGGTDSTVLLHSMVQLRSALGRPIRALHINHQIHPDSADWKNHCRDICRRWEVPYQTLDVSLEKTSHGLEAAARQARYKAFAGNLLPQEMLLTAHHQSDQAETLLLRLMRGTGLSGLRGIPSVRELGAGWVARPLLNTPKSALLAHAEQHNLVVQEDPSNAQTGPDRNFLRLEVMPLLEQRWPGHAATFARTAELASEALDTLNAGSLADLAKCTVSSNIISVKRLKQLPRRRQALALRTRMSELGLGVPTRDQLNALLDSLQTSGNAARLVWGDAEARVYRDALHLMRTLPKKPQGFEQLWTIGATFELPPGLGQLQLCSSNGGIRPSLPEALPVEIRFRRGGERIDLPDESMHRRLKKLFQESGVPPWERNRTPLIWVAGQLWAVGNRWRNGACAAWLTDHRIRLAWKNCTLVDLPHER